MKAKHEVEKVSRSVVEEFMKSQESASNRVDKCGAVEYKMPKAMADAYLKTRGSEDKKMNPQDFLVKVVNEEFGLLHKCERVLIY